MKVFQLGLLLLAGPSLVRGAETVNHVEGSGFQMTATQVVAFADHSGRSLFYVEYNYAFNGHPIMYLDGVGAIPGSGSFKYFTYAKQLAIRESKDAPITAAMKLTATEEAMSAGKPVEAPGDEDFSRMSGELTGTWESSLPISHAGAGVLEHRARVMRGGSANERYMTTVYIPLTNLPQGLRGKVSIRVAYPDEPNSGRFTFRVERVIREGWRKTNELRETTNEAILKAGEEVYRQVVEELRAQGKERP